MRPAERVIRLKVPGSAADDGYMDPATLTALKAMTVGDALGQVPLPVQALVGALMIVSAVWTARRPGWVRAVALVASTAMWARANQGLEGTVLLTLSRDHGLTTADLLPPALLALVLAHVARGRSRRVFSRSAR